MCSGENVNKNGMLLHICCAPCSTYVIEILRKDFFITAYFYNPNIHPEEEYLHRMNEMKGYAEKLSLPFLDGPYEVDEWFKCIRGLEMLGERSERCVMCYRMRLEKTAILAKEKGMDFFATTLSISPHKDASQINRTGKELSKKYGISFLEADFKKKDGFKISIRMSKELGFYRQNYCGCLFSKRKT